MKSAAVLVTKSAAVLVTIRFTVNKLFIACRVTVALCVRIVFRVALCTHNVGTTSQTRKWSNILRHIMLKRGQAQAMSPLAMRLMKHPQNGIYVCYGREVPAN